jgi:hypothetical protein
MKHPDEDETQNFCSRQRAALRNVDIWDAMNRTSSSE